MSLPTFLNCETPERICELAKYLKELSGDESATFEIGPDSTANLRRCIDSLDLCFGDSVSEADLEDALNCAVSLISAQTVTDQRQFIPQICSKFESIRCETNMKKAQIKLYALNTLFLDLPDDSTTGQQEVDSAPPLKLQLYSSLLRCASASKLLHLMTLDSDKIAGWLHEWRCSDTQRQRVWRQLNELHAERGDAQAVATTLILLLQTYSPETATKGRDDAIRCITAALSDPRTLNFDHLLQLEPVKFLEGEPIYNLLDIFVSRTLADFNAFVSQPSGAELFQQKQLDRAVLERKMRVLTLMEMCQQSAAASSSSSSAASGAGGVSELTFAELERALNLNREEVQMFVLEAVQLRAINCKLDQLNEKVIVCGAIPRTFGGTQQWTELLSCVDRLAGSLDAMLAQLKSASSNAAISNSAGATQQQHSATPLLDLGLLSGATSNSATTAAAQ